jgi:glycerol-3-phosphate dehydrogenase subunit B
MKKGDEYNCELVVIGAGMAGMATTLFAANRGISTVQLGHTGGFQFATGLLDLIGVYPINQNGFWQNPWDAIDLLKSVDPIHPYTKVDNSTISESLAELAVFLSDCGLPYRVEPDANSMVLTAHGTTRPTYYVPSSMWNGVSALKQKPSCLLVGFRGLREFSARQIAETQKTVWPGLRPVQIEFPGMTEKSELYPEQLARRLEVPDARQEFAKAVKQQLNGESMLGLPAVLGIHGTSKIMTALEDQIGLPIFEIPTPTISVSGLRLKEAFETNLPRDTVCQLANSNVDKVSLTRQGRFRIEAMHSGSQILIHAEGIVLASGRFLGKGLQADRFKIRETIFDLPVQQSQNRTLWHNRDFFDRSGHPVNRAGILVDSNFHPLDQQGTPAFGKLFAAGSILAGQDWIREKSGSGLAAASAFSAIQSFVSQR